MINIIKHYQSNFRHQDIKEMVKAKMKFRSIFSIKHELKYVVFQVLFHTNNLEIAFLYNQLQLEIDNIPSSYSNSSDKSIDCSGAHASSPQTSQCHQTRIIPPINPLLCNQTIQLQQRTICNQGIANYKHNNKTQQNYYNVQNC